MTRLPRFRLYSLFGTAFTLALAALAGGCSASDCSIAGPAWPDHVGPWLPSQNARPPHLELRIGRDGQIEWSASNYLGGEGRWTRASRVEFGEIMAIAETLSPQPYLVVETSPDADCGTVRSLAVYLERFSLCREGYCLERAAWENYSGE